MFEFNPDLVEGDDAEAGDDQYEREPEEEEEDVGNVRDIDLSMFVPTESDGTGTKAEERTRSEVEETATVNGDLNGNLLQSYILCYITNEMDLIITCCT